MYDHHYCNFGRPPVPDNLCKDSAPRILRSEEEVFKSHFFLPYMGMAAIFVNEP